MIRAKDLKEGQVWQIGKAIFRIIYVDYGETGLVEFDDGKRPDIYPMTCKVNFARFLTLSGAKLVKEGK